MLVAARSSRISHAAYAQPRAHAPIYQSVAEFDGDLDLPEPSHRLGLTLDGGFDESTTSRVSTIRRPEPPRMGSY